MLFHCALEPAEDDIRAHQQVGVFQDWLKHGDTAEAAIGRSIADDNFLSSALWAKVLHLFLTPLVAENI
jgi:hypothetical protein